MICTQCGTKVSLHSEFCSKCGYHFTEEEKQAAVEANSLKSITKSAVAAITATEVKATALSSVIYAVLAAGLGLLFSLVVANIITSIADVETFRLGAISIWLMTCLSGMDMFFAVTLPIVGTLSMNIRLFTGAVLLLIIPALFLLAARGVRHLVMKKLFPERTVQVKDAVIGAMLFALINFALSFVPSSIEISLRDTFYTTVSTFLQNLGATVSGIGLTGLGSSLADEGTMQTISEAITFHLHPLSLIAFGTSFILAFLFAMPSPRVLSSRDNLTSSTLFVAWRFTVRMLFAGLCVSVFLFVYLWIHVGDFMQILPVLLLLPNFVIWMISLLNGGTFNVVFRGSELSTKPDAVADSVRFSDLFSGLSSNWGLLIMLMGILIAFIAIYPMFKEKAGLNNAKAACAVVTAVFVLLIVSITTFFIDINLESSAAGAVESSFALSAEFIRTIVTTIIVFASAFGMIHLTNKSSWFDNILTQITASRGISLGLTAALGLVAAIALVNMYNDSNLANLIHLLQ